MATPEAEPEGQAALDDVVRLLLAERYRVVPRSLPEGGEGCPTCGRASRASASKATTKTAART